MYVSLSIMKEFFVGHFAQKVVRFDCLVIHNIRLLCLATGYSNNIEFNWHSPQFILLIGYLLSTKSE